MTPDRSAVGVVFRRNPEKTENAELSLENAWALSASSRLDAVRGFSSVQLKISSALLVPELHGKV